MFGGGITARMYERSGFSDDDMIDPGSAKQLRKALLGYLDFGDKDATVNKFGELTASHQWTG